jgi:probable phosphoglycerate mutase
MLFIYIRHGEPIYDPDGLTELGKRQAEDVARHLEVEGVDKIFSSTSNRAIETALPTAKRLNKEITYLDFANEKHVWENLTVNNAAGKMWLFQSQKTIELFHTQELIDLGYKWYEHPQFNNGPFKDEVIRIQQESDRFFADLGYLNLGNGKYKVIKENNDKVVMFAHQGFGYAFLSLLLNIPYPIFCTHFELGHAEITLVEFKNENGYSYPKVLTLSKKVI